MAGRFETVIVDAERQPVAGAVVSFYALPDSALVDAVTADADGHVAFANATAMALRAQAIGFLPLVAFKMSCACIDSESAGKYDKIS